MCLAHGARDGDILCQVLHYCLVLAIPKEHSQIGSRLLVLISNHSIATEVHQDLERF